MGQALLWKDYFPKHSRLGSKSLGLHHSCAIWLGRDLLAPKSVRILILVQSIFDVDCDTNRIGAENRLE